MLNLTSARVKVLKFDPFLAKTLQHRVSSNRLFSTEYLLSDYHLLSCCLLYSGDLDILVEVHMLQAHYKKGKLDDYI